MSPTSAGFGNKVPVYFGYAVATAASLCSVTL